MTGHPASARIDALAYGMLEREQVAPLRAHVGGCARCAALLSRRLAEASALRRAVGVARPRGRIALLPWAAAALAAAAVASFFGAPSGRGPEYRPGPASPAAQRETLRTLPDGTEVLASRDLRSLGWREVEAGAGEYYFDVARAEGMPFVVRTPAGEVRVLGTKFFLRVEDRPMNAKTGALVGVAVVSGAVLLWNAAGGTEVGPSERAVMEPDVAPRRTDGTPTAAPELVGASAPQRMAQLEAELRAARHRIEQLEAQAGKPGSTPKPTDAVLDAEIDAAQARFVEVLKRHASGTDADDDLAELMKLAKDRPVFARVVEGLRRRIEANPDDIETRLQLMQAESAGIHVAESIADRAAIGQRVREQIAEVLKRDPDNWEARYTRAVGISHSQKDPKGRADAIREFEAVRVLQEARPLEPRFAGTYAQLALVYLSERNTAKAREVLEAGLARHPDSAALRRQLESLPTGGS